jgi:peptidyl-prolyl cis-trans isomerase SurA
MASSSYAAPPDQAAPEMLVDTVLASIDGKPITLIDLKERLGINGPLSLREVSSDPKYRYTLDALILEQLVEVEAASRRISVSAQDIDSYTEEVASRNNLSRAGFEQALQSEGHKLDGYRARIRFEILKSRLASAVFQGGSSVSEQDVDKYLESRPELAVTGSHVRLSRVFTDRRRDADKAKEKILAAREALSSGRKFADIAREFSEAPEAAAGGSLGLVAEKNLHPSILEQVMELKEGEVSEVIANEAGYQIIMLEERTEDGSEEGAAKLREGIRSTLSREKQEGRMQTYFSSELPAKHSVDRKI